MKWKKELAKDVSSFANSKEGGYIFIGIGTKKENHKLGDVVDEINCLDANLIDIN